MIYESVTLTDVKISKARRKLKDKIIKMMSTETKYAPQSYSKYVYGYLSSLLGFILLVIGKSNKDDKVIIITEIISVVLRSHWTR